MKQMVVYKQISLKKKRRGQAGASLVEYAMLVALIGVVCLAGVASTGMAAGDVFCVARVPFHFGNEVMSNFSRDDYYLGENSEGKLQCFERTGGFFGDRSY